MPSRVQLKVVLLGQMNSGKTCLVTRYISGTFASREQSTIGAAFCQRDISYRGKSIVIGIWDTAGAEQFQAMSAQYYRGAGAAIVCYDLMCAGSAQRLSMHLAIVFHYTISYVTQRSSFNKAKFWVEQLRKNEPDCRVYLAGTKLDLLSDDGYSREVDRHDVMDYASNVDAESIETSARTGKNIDELFSLIVSDYCRTMLAKLSSQQDSSNGVRHLDEPDLGPVPSKTGAPQACAC